MAALVAAVVSYPLMRLSDAAAVITIFALLVIINVVLVHWTTVTNGPRTLFGVDHYTYLWTSVVFASCHLGGWPWFKESPIGLRLRASRDDRLRRRLDRHQHRGRCAGWPSSLSAFIAGFGGGLWAHFITSFSPYSFYLTETFVFLAMLVHRRARAASPGPWSARWW